VLIFAEGPAITSMVIVALLAATITFVMRRVAAKWIESRKMELQREAHADHRRAEESFSSQFSRMEVRLHDFSRDVEGRIQTRLAILDQLVLDADREIARLQDLLKRQNSNPVTGQPLVQNGPDIRIGRPAFPDCGL